VRSEYHCYSEGIVEDTSVAQMTEKDCKDKGRGYGGADEFS